MRFKVLGPLEIRDGRGEPVRLGSPKLRAVLAILLVSANRPLTAGRLVETVWPERPPPTAIGALRTYVSALRRDLQLSTGPGVVDGRLPRLVTDAAGYRMDVTAADLDLLAFEELTSGGEQALRDGDPLAASQQLSKGLALWRGRPLEDVPVDADPDGRLVVAEERRLAASETLVEARLALGQHTELTTELRALVEDNPLRERLWQQWMLALYRSGRQADALAAYRRLRDRLANELGTEPGRAVRDLHEQMLAADPVLDLPDHLSLATRTVVPRQLPADVTTFTGRRTELAELTGLLKGDAAVGAVDGVAGIGKSALAVHAAHLVAASFPDGQLYADLSSDGTPIGVLGRFLRALDVPDAGRYDLDEAAGRFRAETATRRVLVVLDNAADAAQVRPLLPAGPACAVLLTSRRVLATLDGVRHLHLRPLAASESLTLLGQLAGSDRIAADPAAARKLVALCGGLPLAVRIAGARLAARPAWPVRTLTDRLADTRSRLDELLAGDLDVRASLQLSHRLLAAGSAAEREAAAAFGLLGLPDAADLSPPFAERLLGSADPTPVLELLVDAQLLESPAPGRYRLHELLRLLAREVAAGQDLGAVLTKAMRWQVATVWNGYAMLRPGDPRLRTAGEWAAGATAFSDVRAALDWFETERANLLATVEQAAATDGVPDDIPLQLARGLFAFFHIRGHRADWIRLNQTALAVARRTRDSYAEGLAHRDLGAAYELQGEYDQAVDHLRAALRLFTEAVDRASCLNGLGTVYDSLGRYDQAATCLTEALSLAGDPHSRGIYLNNLGPVLGRLGRYDEALRCLAESSTIWAELGNRRGRAAAWTNVGEVYEAAGSPSEALAGFTRGLAMFRELADEAGQAHCLTHLGMTHRDLGHVDRALECLRSALAICERTDDRRGAAQCLRLLSEALQQPGPHGNGQRLSANE
ncbi:MULTISPECIES: BTAD domain-containing putative transcriptional regulator [unclassified Kribbella]|uniref:AfsR/SARP family transcriptional regulator n=1 Tax=unclassified Kribbella TaxID=2644121 RepID=UPI0033F04643